MQNISPNNSESVEGRSSIAVRLPWLDVLRGSAVLLVLFRHLDFPSPNLNSRWMYHAIYTLQRGGWVGVDLFFVLSGFLVSGILFRQYAKLGAIQPWRFLIRRGFKIYPAFWFLLLVTLFWIWHSEHRLPLSNLLVELVFLQNYFPGIYGHTWTLAVEEHCYIGICLLLSLLAIKNRGQKNPFQAIPYLVLTIAIATLAIRLTNPLEMTAVRNRYQSGATHLRYDTFCGGVLLSYCFHFSAARFQRICERFRFAWLLGGIICLVPVFCLELQTHWVVSTWLYSLNAIGGCLLVMGALGTRKCPGRLSRLVAFIGIHSYSIYLWHVLIGTRWLGDVFVTYRIPGGWMVFAPLYFCVSICAGIAMSYVAERPSLYWRERWFPEPLNPQSKITERPSQEIPINDGLRFGCQEATNGYSALTLGLPVEPLS